MDKFIKILWSLKLLSGLIGIGLIVLDLFLMQGIYSIFGFIFLFNFYDLIGFGGMRIIKEYKRGLYDLTIPYYRITQNIFMVTLLILIGILQGWIIPVIAFAYHLSGVTDIMFYIFGKYKFPKVWHWASWTYVGWFYPKSEDGKKYVPNWLMILQASIFTALILLIYFITI